MNVFQVSLLTKKRYFGSGLLHLHVCETSSVITDFDRRVGLQSVVGAWNITDLWNDYRLTKILLYVIFCHFKKC